MDRMTVTVTQLNEYVKDSLAENPVFSDITVSGEISGLKLHSSGHIYFSLKDAGAVIRCAFFKPQNFSLNFKLADGMKVLARGRVTLYVRDGQYQLNVASMQKDGVGELYLRFEQLKAKLAKEGLFDPAHKRSLPSFVKKIGVVTSPTGAVIRDIIHVATRRFPGISIVLAPVQVQGEDAPRSICTGIAYLNDRQDVDVLIVGRGGGSIEDLWGFNDEAVARAIYNSRIPVISAVGHETDFTIADFVADMRAPTPSAAAELAVTEMSQLVGLLERLQVRLENNATQQVRENHLKLQRLSASSALARPEMLLDVYHQRTDHAARRLELSGEAVLNGGEQHLKAVSAKLYALNPLAVLARGYAVVTDTEGINILDAARLLPKSTVNITFAKGRASAQIEKTEQ